MFKKILLTIALLICCTVALAAQGIPFLTYDTFEDSTNLQGEVVVIEFWADWNSENAYDLTVLEGAKVYRVDADKNIDLVREYEIISLPTVLVFYYGDLVHRDDADVTFSKKEEIIHIQDIIDQYIF